MKQFHSTGVHETAGGALQVYCNEDEFYCSKCELDDSTTLGMDNQGMVTWKDYCKI